MSSHTSTRQLWTRALSVIGVLLVFTVGHVAGQGPAVPKPAAAAQAAAGPTNPAHAAALPPALRALKTRPEASNYAETSRYDDVMAFMKAVAAASPNLILLTTMGYTFEGRALPLAVVGHVKDASPEAVMASGKLRIYIEGNIHAGEVEGKEACLELLRAIAGGQHAEWFKTTVLFINPIYNADGNERVKLNNRGSQNGPIGGMGQRANAQEYDLNRDYTKLDAPETRSFARLMNQYDPQITVDLHTTDGSAHAYLITYASPLHPATDPGVRDWPRKELFPAVDRAVREKDDMLFYFYGNFSGGRPGRGGPQERAWYTTEPTARYNANYIGLRNRIAILSETFSYATFQDRIKAARRFVEEICNFTAPRANAVRRITMDADMASIVGQEVGLRARPVKSAEMVEIVVGEVTTEKNPYTGQMMRRMLSTRRPEKMYEYTTFEAAETTKAPKYYLVPANLRFVVDRLEAHGVTMQRLNAASTVSVEQFKIATNVVAEREYQGHKERTLTGAWGPADANLPEGTIVVPVNQPLGRLIVVLLEPRSEDSLATWNLMEEMLGRSPEMYPVMRTSADIPGVR
ncbi:MAG: succinylglutamate desuccinylase/aspartoacylase family protein [Acidobacteria bacterium]|nr:succinylglutamate desuccinylase/aspartoacylase family protein [Acidobacteriota bacterium]